MGWSELGQVVDRTQHKRERSPALTVTPAFDLADESLVDVSAALGISPSLALRKVLASPPLSLQKEGVRNALGLADRVAELVLDSGEGEAGDGQGFGEGDAGGERGSGEGEAGAGRGSGSFDGPSALAFSIAALTGDLEAVLRTALEAASATSADDGDRDAAPPSPRALAAECIAACLADGAYAPRHERMRRGAGMSAERRLETALESLGAPFADEAELRARGYVRTPDALLLAPMAVRGHPVCWVDSKACFGDPETHAKLLETQLQAYVDLFGPGAVVYWHGHVEGLHGAGPVRGPGGALEDEVLVLDGFPPPRSAIELLPELDLATGELVGACEGRREGSPEVGGGAAAGRAAPVCASDAPRTETSFPTSLSPAVAPTASSMAPTNSMPHVASAAFPSVLTTPASVTSQAVPSPHSVPALPARRRIIPTPVA